MIYAWPLSLLIESPFLLYTVVYMLGLLTAGIAAFLLCRELTSSSLVGLVAGGLVVTGAAFGQLQNTSLGWVILVVFFFVRHFERRKWGDALGMTVSGILAGLSNGYFALFTPVAVLALLVTKVVYSRSLPSRRWFLQMGMVVVLVSLALLPTMLVYKDVHDNLGLKRATVRHLKVALPSVGREESGSAPAKNVVPLSAATLAKMLFVACAVVLSLRKGRLDSWVACFLVLAILSFWMSRFGFSPYLLLRKIPAFDALRYASRWVFYFLFSLSTLIAILARPYLKKPVIAGCVLAVAFGLMLSNRLDVAEVVATNQAGANIPQTQVYDHLGELPKGPVLFLPISGERGLFPQIIAANRMLFQMQDHRPMVTGHSGFVPRISNRITRYVVREGISDDCIEKLATTGIRYLVVDRLGGATADLCRVIRKLQNIRILYDSDDQMIAELPRLEVEKDLSRLGVMWALPAP